MTYLKTSKNNIYGIDQECIVAISIACVIGGKKSKISSEKYKFSDKEYEQIILIDCLLRKLSTGHYTYGDLLLEVNLKLSNKFGRFEEHQVRSAMLKLMELFGYNDSVNYTKEKYSCFMSKLSRQQEIIFNLFPNEIEQEQDSNIFFVRSTRTKLEPDFVELDAGDSAEIQTIKLNKNTQYLHHLIELVKENQVQSDIQCMLFTALNEILHFNYETISLEESEFVEVVIKQIEALTEREQLACISKVIQEALKK
jgi:hypothetical protein